MTPEDLTQIEVLADSVRHYGEHDVPDLIAALRSAWAERDYLAQRAIMEVPPLIAERDALAAEVMRIESQRLVSAIFGLPEDQECARPFGLYRHHDVSGVSGEGKVVAHGVEFPDGTVALRWTGGNPTSVVFHDNGMESVEAIHGHGGNTEIIWYAEDITACAAEEEQREKAEAAIARVEAWCDKRQDSTMATATYEVRDALRGDGDE